MRQETPTQTPILGERSDRYFLFLVVLWLWLPSLIRPLTVPDEGRYADVSRWMLTSGDWLIPRLNGLPFFHKPPLLYWIDATLFRIFGVHPEVARIAPVLAGSLACIVTFWFVRRRVGSALARVCALVLATSLLLFGGAQYVNHDMLVGSGISLAVLFFADAAITGERRSMILGYVAAALALMSKGLIGVALPGLVLLPWLIATGRWRQIPQLLHPIGLLVFLALSLPWFFLVQQKYPGFFHYFFIEQQFQRYTTTGFNNKQAWWFYIAGLILAFMPWLFQIGAKNLVERSKNALGAEVAGLMVWWAVAIVGFFSIPQSKLIGYVLPATPPLAVLIAALIYRQPLNLAQRLAGPLFITFFGLALLIGGLTKVGNLTPSELSSIAIIGGALLVAAIALAIFTLRGRVHWLPVTAAASAVWCVAVACTIAVGDHKNNAGDVGIAPYLTPDTELVFVNHYYYDLPFLLNWPKAVAVVEDWPGVTSDSWAKEQKDGVQFDAVAAQKLWSNEKLLAAEKSGQRLLILVPKDVTAPGLESHQPIFQGRNFNAFLIPGNSAQPPATSVARPPLPAQH